MTGGQSLRLKHSSIKIAINVFAFVNRNVAARLHDQIKEAADVSEVKIIGGQRSQIRVTLDEARMAAIALNQMDDIDSQSSAVITIGEFMDGVYERNEAQQSWLESLISQLNGIAGTVHVQRGEDLYLTAAHNIPPDVVKVVARVPHGKGMAGVAQVKKEPVQTCNLQTDESGNIKPGAKAVNAQAAIALPVFNSIGAVRAIVGIAWIQEAEIGVIEQQRMMKLVADLPQ